MTTLTALSAEIHGQLKVSDHRSIAYARGRHMIPLHIGEVSRAIMDFPVLISRLQGQGDYALSALTSFSPGKNAFLDGDIWQSSFQPSEMQTFPFALIRGDNGGDNGEPVLAFDQSLPVFSTTDGEDLFDTAGQPAIWTNQLKNQLLSIAEHTALTRHFLEVIAELGLISQIVITLHQGTEDANKIGGLHTINEDRLKSLTPEQLDTLNTKGFLGPIYAILFSIFQLNTLIRRHNDRSEAAQKIIREETQIWTRYR